MLEFLDLIEPMLLSSSKISLIELFLMETITISFTSFNSAFSSDIISDTFPDLSTFSLTDCYIKFL